MSAQDAKSDAVAKEVTAVKQALEAKFPGAPIRNVSKSPYFGLFEAQLDDRMLYTDGKVNYVIVGSVYDTATRTNLTDQRMKRMNRIAWDSLPLEVMHGSQWNPHSTRDLAATNVSHLKPVLLHHVRTSGMSHIFLFEREHNN